MDILLRVSSSFKSERRNSRKPNSNVSILVTTCDWRTGKKDREGEEKREGRFDSRVDQGEKRGKISTGLSPIQALFEERHSWPNRSILRELPDMKSASEGGGGSWKSGCSEGGCVNFIV